MGRLFSLSIVASISLSLPFFAATAKSETAIDAGSLVATPHGPRQWYLDFRTPSPFRDALSVTNDGDTPSAFELTWNGGLFYRQSQIVAEIAKLPEAFAGEPLHLKAFRYVRDRRAWWETFATGNWHTHPIVNLNGLGANICGTDSRMFALLLHNMGYQTRTTWYPHHGVAGVMVDGKWGMYDITYGVYYLDDEGQVVDEVSLATDSTPILDPSHKVVGFNFSDATHTDHAHSAGNAEVLREKQSVGQAPLFNSPLQPPHVEQGLSFTLPPQASVTLPVALSRSSPTREDGYPEIGAAPVFAGATISVPTGATGEVDAPLPLVSVEGSGRFELHGDQYDTESLNAYLAEFSTFSHEVWIKEAQEDLTFSYSLNPKILSYGTSNEIVLRGVDGAIISNLRSENVPLPPDRQVPTGTLFVETVAGEEFSVDGVHWYASGSALELPSRGTRWDAYMVQFRNGGTSPESGDLSVQIFPGDIIRVVSSAARH